MSTDGPSIATGRLPGEAGEGGVPAAAAAVLALCIGAAVPAAVFGKAVLGVVLVPAVAVVLFALTRSDVRLAVLRTATSSAGLALGFFGLVALISVLSSEYALKSLETWARTAAFVFFGLTAMHVLARDRHALDLARRTLVFASLVALSYVVVAVYLFDEVLALIALGTELRNPPALNFKGFASAVVCVLPVALWGAGGPGLGPKALRLCLLVLAALAIWLDGSEISLAAILGIVAALILLGVVRILGGLPRRLRALAVVGMLAAGALSGAAVTVALPEIDEIEPDRLSIPTWLVDGHRQFIWAFTVKATRHHPVFGHGPNSINRIEGADRRLPGRNVVILPSHPHSWVYEIASETGLVGLAALCVGLLLLLRRLAVLALNGSRAGWTAVALFGAFWGSSLVNFSIWSAWWQLTFIVLLAILVAAAQRPPDGTRRKASNGP